MNSGDEINASALDSPAAWTAAALEAERKHWTFALGERARLMVVAICNNSPGNRGWRYASIEHAMFLNMDKSTRLSYLISLLMVGAGATFGAAPAWAQIYKWVDDHGVVNYSHQAPANRKAKELDTSAITLSVFEAEKPGHRAAPARSEVASLSDKIDRLERQLEAERQARQYAAAVDARALQAAYDQCVSQRGVDCNVIYNGFYPYGSTAVFVPRFHRFRTAPHFPVTPESRPWETSRLSARSTQLPSRGHAAPPMR